LRRARLMPVTLQPRCRASAYMRTSWPTLVAPSLRMMLVR
jgi:hypothetical protein